VQECNKSFNRKVVAEMFMETFLNISVSLRLLDVPNEVSGLIMNLLGDAMDKHVKVALGYSREELVEISRSVFIRHIKSLGDPRSEEEIGAQYDQRSDQYLNNKQAEASAD
jgi:hypothetical protein